jgi:hypothetical protein
VEENNKTKASVGEIIGDNFLKNPNIEILFKYLFVLFIKISNFGKLA